MEKNNQILITSILFLTFLQITYSQTPVCFPGYPKIIDTLRAPALSSGTPLIADINNDGQKEIIYGADGYNTGSGYRLYVLNNDGSVFANFPKNYVYVFSMAAGDIDKDGYLDIVIRAADSVDVINRFGNHLTGFPVYCPYGSQQGSTWFQHISLYDLDNDGWLEIIVNSNGKLNVFNHNGIIKSGWPKSFTGQISAGFAVGDLDNDNMGEIVFSSYKLLNNPPYVDSGAMHVWRHDGSNFSSNWPIYYDSLYITFFGSTTLYIAENNPLQNQILVTTEYNISTLNAINRITQYDINANILKRTFQHTTMGLGSIVMGDMDNDGSIEYVTGTQVGDDLSAYGNNFEHIIGYPVLGNCAPPSTAIIGKLKYGNELNILSNISSQNPANGGYIFAYNYNASQLTWSPLRPFGLVIGLSVADINNDGSIEIISTSTRTNKETYLTIWTIPGIAYNNDDFPWPMYGHDRYRTNQYGFIPPDEPIGIKPLSNEVPNEFILEQNYPNPFNPATTIKYGVKTSSLINLTLYDMLGREVSTIVNESLKPGTYSVSFDGSNLSSGIYYYRLTSDGVMVDTKKMVLIN